MSHYLFSGERLKWRLQEVLIDELSVVVFGDDMTLPNGITMHNPTITEIKKFGHLNYIALVQLITMRSYDTAVELWDNGISYKDVPDFLVFINNMKNLTVDFTRIIFGDLDFSKFETSVDQQNLGLVFTNGDITIDELVYRDIVEFVRGINYINPKVEFDVGNNQSLKFLVERMRRKQKKNAKKKSTPFLANVISSMVCRADFPYDYNTIQDIHISQLYNGFYRVEKHDTSHYLTTAIYAGTVSKKDISNSLLTWYGDLNKE